MFPQIIAITGHKYNGKDTIGDYLVSNYNYTKLTFAEPIKKICQIVFGLNYDQLHGHLKEVDDPYWATSPRKLMQFVGTELFRNHMHELIPNINEDIWLCVLKKQIQDKLLVDNSMKFVITDLRFGNEYDLIRSLNGNVWRVKRDGVISNDTHSSELFIDRIEVDNDIENNGTLDQLYASIDSIMKK